jgi:hypothetical protein
MIKLIETMRKIVFVLLLIPMISFSQDKLEVKKGKFYRGTELLNVKDFTLSMESNPEAFKLANSAKSSYSAANVLGFIGGFMVGWPLGTAIGGGDPEWGLLAAGAGVLAIAIPISVSSTKKMKAAAEIYNKGSNTSSSAIRLDLSISPTRTGLVLRF